MGHRGRDRRCLDSDGAMASSLLSEPLKNYAERQASERLPNFDITIGTLHVQPFRLGMGVEDLQVRLRAKPDPPLAAIPQLKVHTRFLPLLTGKIDVNLEIKDPQFAATSQQVDSVLHTIKQEAVKQEAVPWQDTMRNMMPIHISLSLSHGEVRSCLSGCFRNTIQRVLRRPVEPAAIQPVVAS